MSATLDVPEPLDPRQEVLDEKGGFRVDVQAHERSMREVNNPSLDQLVKHAKRWGKTGVLEAGMHLSDEQFLSLRKQIARLP